MHVPDPAPDDANADEGGPAASAPDDAIADEDGLAESAGADEDLDGPGVLLATKVLPGPMVVP